MKRGPLYLFGEFKKGIKNIFNNLVLLVTLIICLGFNIFLWFFILLVYQQLKDITIIHYSVLIGVNWLENKSYLFIFPFSGLVVFVFNFIFAVLFYQTDKKLLSHYLVFTIFLINIFLTVGFFLIYTL